jgi:aerobic C4-dicarboxylate transport protein
MPKKKFYSNLYFQVLAGIALGVALGFAAPEQAVVMQPLGDGFIKLVKMLIAPVVFTTVVVGIAQMGAMKDVGRIGLSAIVYFEVVSLLALAIGLAVVTMMNPGGGVGFDPAAADLSSIAAYTATAQRASGPVEFVLGIIPDTIVGAFARGDVLQVLLFSVLVGAALSLMGERANRLVEIVALASKRSSSWSGSSCGWRRSGRSARWPSRSGATASGRSSRSGTLSPPCTLHASVSSSSCWARSRRSPVSVC